MEEISSKVEFLRQGSASSPLGLKTAMTGKSSPRNSPTSRRLGSNRNPRRDSRAFTGKFSWIRNNKVLFWLLLITIWAYVGFHVQSQWAHGDHKAEFVGYNSELGKMGEDVKSGNSTTTFSTIHKERLTVEGKKDSDSNFGISLIRKGKQVLSRINSRKKKGHMSMKVSAKSKEETEDNGVGENDELMIQRKNTSYGLIVGLFAKTEDSVVEGIPGKRRGMCNRKGEFARAVSAQRFMLIFHELSMTGAPLSMLELATEILSCGGSVSAIVLSKKGGLMPELNKVGIKVLQDRDRASFKAAMKYDLIIAGSAVCSSWIEPYLRYFPAGSGHIVWWIMENRREYFDRSKHLLNRVKILAFLSDSQSKQWLSWCEEENIKFLIQPMLVPLYVKDELAFVAGIPCSLNTPALSVEKMTEKRDLLRRAARREMGLGDNNMLVMSLSSINPAKGHRFLLEAALLVAEHNVSLKDVNSYSLMEEEQLSVSAPRNQTIMNGQLKPGPVVQIANDTDKPVNELQKVNATRVSFKKRRRKRRNNTATEGEQQKSRKLLLEAGGMQEETLKILIGSVGSKSNKLLYVKAIMGFISQHSNLSKVVLWTPATTRVAALYAAADVYVINAQGLGETFGRVTIEAMAFGLPVLGTDAGGTKEIIDHRVTGLLHPVGPEGTQVLAQHIQYLLKNPSVRMKMGMNGRKKVQNKYLKHQTYESLGKVMFKSMRPRLIANSINGT